MSAVIGAMTGTFIVSMYALWSDESDYAIGLFVGALSVCAGVVGAEAFAALVLR